MTQKSIVAIDVIAEESAIQYTGTTAFYRIDPGLRDFISKCEKEYGVIGFEYTLGELNLGILLNGKGK